MYKRGMLAVVLTMMLAAPAGAQFFMFENPLVGEKAPEFRLSTVQGSELSLSEARGQGAAIIFFWATWCPHCRVELKEMYEQRDEFAQKEIKLLFVDVGEDAATVQKYLDKQGMAADVFLDETTDVSEDYKVVGVPTFYFIDAAGVVQAVEHSLPENYEELFKG